MCLQLVRKPVSFRAYSAPMPDNGVSNLHISLNVEHSWLRSQLSQTLRCPRCMGWMFVQEVPSSFDLLTVALRHLFHTRHLRTFNQECQSCFSINSSRSI